MLTEKINSLKFHYKILGLEEGASLEQVTARWIELKKEFQLNPDKDDEALKTMKEVNEAYKILKGSVSSSVEFDMQGLLKEVGASWRAKKEKRRKKIIISSSILAIFLIIGAYIFIPGIPRLTTQLTSTTQDGPIRNIQRPNEKTVPASESQTPLKIAKVEPRKASKADMPEIAKPVPTTPPPLKTAPPVEVTKKVVPQEPSKKIVRERAKPVPPPPPAARPARVVEVVKEVAQEPVKTLIPDFARPPAAAPPLLRPAPAVEIAKEVAQEPTGTETVVSEAAKPVPPAPSVLKSALSQPPASGPPTEGEIRQFLGSYINSYNNKSIDRFISFFSPKAIQNQKDDLEKIRKTYDTFFDKMETVQYRVTIKEVRSQQNSVEVKGQYSLEGVLMDGRKRQNWKGQVRWVLVREDGGLKILSLDYQPQK